MALAVSHSITGWWFIAASRYIDVPQWERNLKGKTMRLRLTLILTIMSCVPALGQVIVDDNFDSYANDAAFESVWPPYTGDGTTSCSTTVLCSGPIGLIVPRTVPPFPPAPFDGSGDPTVTPPVEPLVGQAVAFNEFGGINEWDDDNNSSTLPFELLPSATKSIRYEADIFDFVNGNRRFSVGLRNDTVDRSPDFGLQAGVNFVELGFYNANGFDPTNPINLDANTRVFDVPATGYGYRVGLFGAPGGDLVMSPDWQYFNLPLEFDDPVVDHNGDGRVGNGDGLVTPVDVGPGWHTFSATISESDVTVELDLFRDGTVDASQTWEIQVQGDPLNPGLDAPFTSLRIGGPSGISMNELTMVDNVKLELIDVMGGISGDFDGNGDYDCGDVDSLVVEIVAGTNNAAFDLTGDGLVNGSDLTSWLAEAGAAELASGNPYQLGDANLDGSVDVPDFNVWNANKFTNTPAWCSGDFNADGVVDVPDFNAWNGNKFTSADGVQSVPEPMAGVLLLLGSLAFLGRRN